MGAPKETLGFQAEVKQLLQLMIHSLYSNKEIFLRELVSNASDACDKLRFEAIAQPGLLEGHAALAIGIEIDKAARTLTVSDNGIGMSRDEAIEHLGTIARSGTREFFARLTGDQQKDAQLIGQFGVGFYSSFIVADKVSVVTRRAGQPVESAVRWESDGGGEFTIEPAERAESGTDVTLQLREGEDELLEAERLRHIVTRYSDHISLPIRMRTESWDADAKAMKPGEAPEVINQASALWARPKSEIDEAQYRAFYKHVSHDFGEPLAWTHNRVEGRSEYIQLLYVPERAPFDLWDRHQRHGIKLYVRRVFIMEDAEQLLPPYLRFVRGVIDSNDLPLNVSRELLQESRDVRMIREGSAKRVLSMLEDMAEKNPEKYATFWGQFGQVFKEGIGEDAANRERIAKLLRFASSANDGPEQTVSLAEYLGRMKDKQDRIYYATADSWDAARASPHLEIFRKKGIEVLLLADRVDAQLMSRAVAGHAASIGIAGALSFVFAAGLAGIWGWQGAFAAAGLCAALGWTMVALGAPRALAPVHAARHGALFDFRPVLANRSAMAYAVAYCVHTLEMSALRGWVVAFLGYVAASSATPTASWLAPATVATAMALLGTWASVLGNEWSIRWGRKKLIAFAMLGAAVLALAVGLVGPSGYAAATLLVLAWAAFIWLDSSSLTAGAAGSAAPARRGATLAVHSMLGYLGGFIGPFAVGGVLDLAGGMSPLGWSLAFGLVALVVVAGYWLHRRLGPQPLAGDRGYREADA